MWSGDDGTLLENIHNESLTISEKHIINEAYISECICDLGCSIEINGNSINITAHNGSGLGPYFGEDLWSVTVVVVCYGPKLSGGDVSGSNGAKITFSSDCDDDLTKILPKELR